MYLVVLVLVGALAGVGVNDLAGHPVSRVVAAVFGVVAAVAGIVVYGNARRRR